MRTTAFLLALLLPAFSARADQAAAARKYRGQIIVSDHEINPDSDDKELKKLQKTVIEKSGETWTIYFMGFMTKKPSATPINLVFYDLAGGKRTYVSNKEINIDPGSTILVSDVEVSEDDGLKVGGKYEMVLGRKVGGRETVFAKTKLSFK